MKPIQFFKHNLPSFRDSVRAGSGLLAAAGQRAPVLQPCATMFFEASCVQSILHTAVPFGVAFAGTHALSGASVAVVPAGSSTNPASAVVGSNFRWFCTNSGSDQIESYSVSGLPPGLKFTFGKPISSITGKPSTAGTYTVKLVGWEKPRKQGDHTATYSLKVKVKPAGPAVPEIAVEQPAGSGLTDGASKKSFGTVVVGQTGSAKTFKILNAGTAPLTGLSVTMAGSAAQDFQAGSVSSTTVAAGGSATFKVKFRPTAAGVRSAVLNISSNDADENPFNIKLAGQGAP